MIRIFVLRNLKVLMKCGLFPFVHVWGDIGPLGGNILVENWYRVGHFRQLLYAEKGNFDLLYSFPVRSERWGINIFKIFKIENSNRTGQNLTLSSHISNYVPWDHSMRIRSMSHFTIDNFTCAIFDVLIKKSS